MATRNSLARQIRNKLRELGAMPEIIVRVYYATHHKKAGERWLNVLVYAANSDDRDLMFTVPRNIEQAALALLVVMA